MEEYIRNEDKQRTIQAVKKGTRRPLFEFSDNHAGNIQTGLLKQLRSAQRPVVQRRIPNYRSGMEAMYTGPKLKMLVKQLIGTLQDNRGQLSKSLANFKFFEDFINKNDFSAVFSQLIEALRIKYPQGLPADVWQIEDLLQEIDFPTMEEMGDPLKRLKSDSDMTLSGFACCVEFYLTDAKNPYGIFDVIRELNEKVLNPEVRANIFVNIEGNEPVDKGLLAKIRIKAKQYIDQLLEKQDILEFIFGDLGQPIDLGFVNGLLIAVKNRMDFVGIESVKMGVLEYSGGGGYENGGDNVQLLCEIGDDDTTVLTYIHELLHKVSGRKIDDRLGKRNRTPGFIALRSSSQKMRNADHYILAIEYAIEETNIDKIRPFVEAVEKGKVIKGDTAIKARDRIYVKPAMKSILHAWWTGAQNYLYQVYTYRNLPLETEVNGKTLKSMLNLLGVENELQAGWDKEKELSFAIAETNVRKLSDKKATVDRWYNTSYNHFKNETYGNIKIALAGMFIGIFAPETLRAFEANATGVDIGKIEDTKAIWDGAGSPKP